MAPLRTIRTKIDKIDREISALLQDRVHLVRQVKDVKIAGGMPSYDGEREQEVYDNYQDYLGENSYTVAWAVLNYGKQRAYGVVT